MGFPRTETGKVFAAIAASVLALGGASGGCGVSTAAADSGGATAARSGHGTPTADPDRAGAGGDQPAEARRSGALRIAIPVSGDRLSSHFGHCERFALMDAIARSFLEGTLVTGGNICDHERMGMDLVNGAFFDHFINPRNAGLVRDADGVGKYGDPVCGDFLADGGRRLISRAGGEFPRPACLRKATGCV